jgi:hypothetical protein
VIYYKTVLADDVEVHLALSWLVCLPVRPHPVADAYRRVLLEWRCKCPPRAPAR